MHPSSSTLAAWMADLPVRASGEQDAWTRTHVNVRVNSRSRLAVHRLIDRWQCNVVTGCGDVLTLDETTFTAAEVTCRHLGCAVRSEQNAERPAPVDRPGGAYQDLARQNNSRSDATGNSVDDRTDRDSFRSVKNRTDNPEMVRPIPRSQVATAEADLARDR
jgi:hypothetical protein